MGCVFCQNEKISKKNFGKNITIKRLASIMLELQDNGAININLVTPTPHVMGIIKAIEIAKKMGLNIPIIYNTSSYETVETIELLDGIVDVYLPDLKYFDDTYALKYSKSPDYFKTACEVIKKMYEQVGNIEFDELGNIKKGVIVRHLMLPTLKEDTKKILSYLYKTYKDNIYISIMNQYTVMDNLEYKELKRTIKTSEYNEIIDYAIDLGIKNAFCQLEDTSSKDFIPEFDLTGVNH